MTVQCSYLETDIRASASITLGSPSFPATTISGDEPKAYFPVVLFFGTARYRESVALTSVVNSGRAFNSS